MNNRKCPYNNFQDCIGENCQASRWEDASDMLKMLGKKAEKRYLMCNLCKTVIKTEKLKEEEEND